MLLLRGSMESNPLTMGTNAAEISLLGVLKFLVFRWALPISAEFVAFVLFLVTHFRR